MLSQSDLPAHSDWQATGDPEGTEDQSGGSLGSGLGGSNRGLGVTAHLGTPTPWGSTVSGHLIPLPAQNALQIWFLPPLGQPNSQEKGKPFSMSMTYLRWSGTPHSHCP